ncbi:hypothetical protein ACJIZ3_014332 [Penstemon smallii]|uniref:Uncharacterized protein n=1 Tax=Penstemon smallii TaxID=265156 RepID=A0ABD3RJC7_9LAMI
MNMGTRGRTRSQLNEQAQLQQFIREFQERGATKGISVQNQRWKTRVVSDNARHFKTEACISQHAPLKYPYFKDIPFENKRKMWLPMMVYTNRRHKLHLYYKDHKYDANVLNQPPEGVILSDWELLINYFENEEFQNVSGRNSENQAKLKMRHICGTKFIAQFQLSSWCRGHPTNIRIPFVANFSEKWMFLKSLGAVL